MRELFEMAADAATFSLLAAAYWRLRNLGDTETSKFWTWVWTGVAVINWVTFVVAAAAWALGKP